jgi:hypothetical protein
MTKWQRRLSMGAQDPFNIRKWIFPAGAISILIGFGLFLHACGKMEATKEREIMAVTKTNAIPNLPMPTIDRSAPLKTETATFALG